MKNEEKKQMNNWVLNYLLQTCGAEVQKWFSRTEILKWTVWKYQWRLMRCKRVLWGDAAIWGTNKRPDRIRLRIPKTGWRVNALKGGWGDAARTGGGMEEPSLEALMQAGLIFVVGVAIILSNLLIIATYLNFRGKFHLSPFFPT